MRYIQTSCNNSEVWSDQSTGKKSQVQIMGEQKLQMLFLYSEYAALANSSYTTYQHWLQKQVNY